MEKKYFFFDIDGTLTDDATHKIVPSALQTLHKLEEAGHFVAIATGRIHYKAKSFTDSIGIYNVVCSGGGCLVINNEIVSNKPLDREKAVRFLEEADAHGIGWVMIRDDTDRVWMKDMKFLEQAGLRRELTTYTLDPELDYHQLAEIFKIYIALDRNQIKEHPWADEMGHLAMGRYHVIQYDEKKQGILEMMKALGGDVKDVVVFGDEVNDLVMFDPMWTSIAMGNGCDELKAKADYITDRNVDDGIRNACLKFGWISE